MKKLFLSLMLLLAAGSSIELSAGGDWGASCSSNKQCNSGCCETAFTGGHCTGAIYCELN